MSNYRIKIEEKNNGEKVYIPQTCKLESFGVWTKRQQIVWYNIHRVGVSFGLSKTITVRYGNEEDVLKVIEEYKNKHQVEKDNEIKSTTYKMID
jgi:hypothetical protein